MALINAPASAAPFVGVWALLSFTESSTGLAESKPLGEKPEGFLIYTADGFVSAQLMQTGRKALVGDPWDAKASTDGGDLSRGYIAYCGSYEVDLERGEVIHRPAVALLPSLIDHDQHRTFRFDNDVLTLVTTREHPSQGTIKSHLVWRRTKPSPQS